MTNFHSDNYRTQPDVEDLKLYAENFSGTHYNNLGCLLTKKYKKEDFSYAKACLACERYLVTPAAKDYARCHLGWGAGKWFAVIDLIDSNSKLTKLRYWGVNKDTIRDEILLNEVYIIKPQYSDGWGFSTRGHVDRTWKRMTTNKED